MNNSKKIETSIKPKLGFVGIGWIGKRRLRAIEEEEAGVITAVVDPDTVAIGELQDEIKGVRKYDTFEEMLESDIEGVVIASPSALHAEQSLQALEKRKAVFCQKPLGRNEKETEEVVEDARRRNLLLSVDLSYRYTKAVKEVRNIIRSGELGRIYGINLVFHNAYGPGKSWYYDAKVSGGGCVMDLGTHLIDLLFWVMDEPEIGNISSRLYSKGKHLKSYKNKVEDYAAAQFTVNDEATVQFSCSWDLPAGKDAIIEAIFYGEKGGVAFRNLEDSFYHFTAEKYTGTSTEVLSAPPDNWEGRAAVQWSETLSKGNQFDSEAEIYVKVARALDLIYQKSSFL